MNAGCAGKTVRFLENACHIPERLNEALYKSTFTLPLPLSRSWLDDRDLSANIFGTKRGNVLLDKRRKSFLNYERSATFPQILLTTYWLTFAHPKVGSVDSHWIATALRCYMSL